MPELPEVEVTRRSVGPPLVGARVLSAEFGLPLRWPLGHDPALLAGTVCGEMTRRGKYLWLPLSSNPGPGAVGDVAVRPAGLPWNGEPVAAPPASAGGLLIHLGMSGALSFGDGPAAPGPYDHFRLHTDRGLLWLTDPRRFGAVVWSASPGVDPARKLLAGLGPEPFDPALDEKGFHAALKARRTPVKAALLSGEIVVGAGNIYACEALHLARIDPRTPANKISGPRAALLLSAVRQVLRRAIDAGGSTLKDFSANGAAGHYQEQAHVYGRGGRAVHHLRQPGAPHRAGAARDVFLRQLPEKIRRELIVECRIEIVCDVSKSIRAGRRAGSSIPSRGCRLRLSPHFRTSSADCVEAIALRSLLAWPIIRPPGDAEPAPRKRDEQRALGMTTKDQSLVPALDALANWRQSLARELSSLTHFFTSNDLLSAPSADISESLRQRMLADKLVVAFVAEFSRGKSELINAIFFADTGRRILPATPGRTTMCPVELGWDEREKPMLDLLPIDTRREGSSLTELRQTREGWKRVALDPDDPQALADALAEVTHVHKVTPDVARELGLWSETDPEDNPPLDEDGLVEVPAWRHAVINYPHPLLARGLVVLDTPGLNAIGTEPELTLGLLPGAHAALFLLGADAGVTKSDLSVWNEHLGGQNMPCFVVLNKVDTLADPLLSAAQNEALVQRQCDVTAQTLQMPRDRVFPVSARNALHARLNGNDAELAKSRLPVLEAALTNELLPARQQVLTHAMVSGVEALRAQVNARLRDQRRQNSEQLLELRGLRGKSGARVRHLLDRVGDDAAEFERCVTRLTALRAVQTRLLRDTQNQLSSERIRAEVKQLQTALNSGWLHLGARQAFLGMCDKLRHALSDAEVTTSEAREMLQGTFRQLNAEFGFSLSIALPPELANHREELAAIERGYNRYFGLSETLRMASSAFKERFVRMLVSKLRVVFETAARDIELWHQSASAQMEAQLRDRRRSFRKRRESLERIQQAAGDLEERVTDVEQQSARIEALITDVALRCETLAVIARRGPVGIESEHFDLPIDQSVNATAVV